MSVSAKITEKGQVTIPQPIRKLLNTNLISFLVVDGVVIVKPIRDVGGSLHAYVKNAENTTSFHDKREAAWKESIREKTAGKSS